jgi:hypothetical protein
LALNKHQQPQNNGSRVAGMTAITRQNHHTNIISLHVPFRIVRRGGRKELQLPQGAQDSRRIDSTLVKALARACRWKRMLDSGEFATIRELAEREGITPSYITRALRLTLLAPEIVVRILDGKQGLDMTLARAQEYFPLNWSLQSACFVAKRC